MFALDDGRVIDATTRGNVARYINHSCGGGTGNVAINPLTGKMEARGKGVRALERRTSAPPAFTSLAISLSLTIRVALLCECVCLALNCWRTAAAELHGEVFLHWWRAQDHHVHPERGLDRGGAHIRLQIRQGG
jgi:hypothetical protein